MREIPAPSAGAAASLLLTFRKASAAKTRAKALAKRGYLGCYPFAHTKRDDVVLRLLPNHGADEAPVAVIYADSAEPMTIAPNLRHMVAGRLAQIDYCHPVPKRTSEAQAEILQYAAVLGTGDSARAVFAACKAASKIKSTAERLGRLWAAAKDFDPLFEVLGGAWTFQMKEIPGWLRTLAGEARSHPIVRNIRVSYNTQFKTGDDVTEDAWNVVFGDQVFDRSYTGIVSGPAGDMPEMNAVHYAVTFLRRKPSNDRRYDSLDWAAAQAAADDPKYDGEAHLRAALKMAKADPAAAYTQLANALFYAGRSKRGPATEIAKASLDLAKKNEWVDLAEVLAMQTATT